ncbi:MAG: LPS assembly protein LptD [Planctomycetota bacterium]
MLTRIAAISAAAIALMGVVSGAQAQTAFSRVLLTAEPIDSGVEFQTRRANAWIEPDGTQRLSLDTDVRIRLAGYDLAADRAAVWISEREDLSSAADTTRFAQIFVYLEGVDTPLAEPAVAVTADDLRIQGVLRLLSPPVVAADRVADTPADNAFEDRAVAAFEEAITSAEAVVPLVDASQPPPLPPDDPGDTESVAVADDLAPSRPPREPIIEPDGFITLAADRVTRVIDESDGSAIVLDGGMHVAYTIPGDSRVLELSAQRAVVFLNEQGAESGAFGAINESGIDGIYLEGDVIATDKGYTLRGPRVYYDVAQDKALVLDAVFSTSDQSRGFPLYVRADSIRQVSRDEFVADRARLSNTAFARPNITLGTRTVTLTQTAAREDASDTPGRQERRTIVDARGITLNAGTAPVAWLPRFRGDPERIPLRQLSFVNVTDSGGEIRTEWDAITLLGLESRDDLDVRLLADALFERGPGLGIEASWDTADREGGLLTYWVIEDSGTDVLSTSARIERDNETRGIVRGEDRKTINNLWTLRTEIAHVTDPAFVDSFYEPLAETGREFQTRAHLTRREEHTIFTFEVTGQLDDFTPNEFLLQSQGYSVERLPEATYTRLADDVLPGLPGRLTYTSQSRVGLLRFENYDAMPAEFGFLSNARAQQAFGINANETFDAALAAQGQTEDYRFRFDSRHEVTADLELGPIQITPWVTGRVTAYDDDFAEFGPGSGDETRIHFVSGATASTTTQRVIDGVYSRALDVNRLRHLITPSVTVFNAVTSVDQDELPVYDEAVESLANGTVVRVALEQTVQTQRGGPGRWYNADLLTLDAEMVFSTDDAVGESSIGRFDPARPELSRLSDFSTVSGTFQLSDSIAITGGTIYDLDRERSQLTTAGLLVDHHSGLSSFVRYRRLQDQDSTLLSTGFDYALTEKYDLNSSVTFDTEDSTVQSVNAEVLRSFQSAVFGAAVTYNNVQESTSVGVIFQPLGQGSATRIGGRESSADNRGSPLGG